MHVNLCVQKWNKIAENWSSRDSDTRICCDARLIFCIVNMKMLLNIMTACKQGDGRSSGLGPWLILDGGRAGKQASFSGILDEESMSLVYASEVQRIGRTNLGLLHPWKVLIRSP